MKKLISGFGMVLLFLACVGLAYGSSVAEVAKKEKERRAKLKETNKESNKVFTNQDIADFKAKNKDKFGDEDKDSEEQEPAKEETTQAKKEEPVELRDNEAYWRKAFAESSGKVNELQNRLDQMQSDYNALSRNTGISDTQLSGELGSQREEMERVKQQLEEAKAATENLQEQARKAGAPPGWVRE